MAASRRAAPSTSEASHRRQRVRQQTSSAKAVLRRELHAGGLRYRVQVPVFTRPRRGADVAFSGLRVAAFVDGCFRHGCPEQATWPKANTDFWRSKILANKERDLDSDRRLREDGWVVVRAWAHEAPGAVASHVVGLLRSRRDTESSR